MWSLLSLVLSLLGVLSSITLMAHYILKRDKRPTTAAEDPDAPVARPSRWNVLRVTACGVGILLVVLFLVLENLALPMTWINMHTVWFLLLFLVQMTMVLVFALRGISLRKGNCSSPS